MNYDKLITLFFKHSAYEYCLNLVNDAPNDLEYNRWRKVADQKHIHYIESLQDLTPNERKTLDELVLLDDGVLTSWDEVNGALEVLTANKDNIDLLARNYMDTLNEEYSFDDSQPIDLDEYIAQYQVNANDGYCPFDNYECFTLNLISKQYDKLF
jgi:hypothetical protein